MASISARSDFSASWAIPDCSSASSALRASSSLFCCRSALANSRCLSCALKSSNSASNAAARAAMAKASVARSLFAALEEPWSAEVSARGKVKGEGAADVVSLTDSQSSSQCTTGGVLGEAFGDAFSAAFGEAFGDGFGDAFGGFGENLGDSCGEASAGAGLCCIGPSTMPSCSATPSRNKFNTSNTECSPKPLGITGLVSHPCGSKSSIASLQRAVDPTTSMIDSCCRCD
mmetsp:Transcript_36881/g.64966  ORF Transcript_36881/g.64966 Transcript_36881/m.64966 type:complete len:231 (-) Transcript_36881:102-794(-)